MEIKRTLKRVYFSAKWMFNLLRPRKGAMPAEDYRKIISAVSPKPEGSGKKIYNSAIDESTDLSIIIPVYNTEKYLRECLDSVVSQKTSYCFEAICVNDGSTDNSLNILREYSRNYPDINIRIIDQNNRGFSGARNRGIDEAKGKYLMFLDSDDSLAANGVQLLMEEAYRSGHEIVCGGYSTFDENGTQIWIDKEIHKDNVPQPEIYYYPYFLWGKVYKREVWQNIRLPEGYWFEDMICGPIIYHRCKSFSYLPESIYNYRINPNGITMTASTKPKALDQYWMIEYIEDEYMRLGLVADQDYKKFLIRELGPYLCGRTGGLSEDVHKAVFMCAADLIEKYDFETESLNKKEKRMLKALQSKNYELWQIASTIWVLSK